MSGSRSTTGSSSTVDARPATRRFFAAGDVAEQDGFFGGRFRQETYQNAADQAQAGALAMLGQEVSYCKPMWYWSDQFDLNIQFCGQIPVEADIAIRGEMDSNTFVAFFLAGEAIEGVLTVNRAPDMGVGKRLVERRARASAASLADVGVSWRGLLKQAG